MNCGTDIHMGLPKPEKDFEVSSDFNAMREAIERGRRDNALIANCLNAAQYRGLSGEDKYVLLAYAALRMLEDTWQRNMELVRLSPNVPPIVIDPAKSQS